MAFTIQTWKEQAGKRLQKAGDWLAGVKQSYAPRLLYGGLCGAALWPLIQAAQKGQTLDVMMALGTVAAGIGGNLLAEQVQRWKDRADQQTVTQWVVEQAPANPELRQALDDILDKLDAIPQAQAGLSEADHEWFNQTLQKELAQLGNLERFKARLVGSGAIAQGHSVAAGAGGVAVGGDVHGDIVMGSKTTMFDQRGQSVQRQVNVAGDWKGPDVPDGTEEE